MIFTDEQIAALRDLALAVEVDELPAGLTEVEGWERHPTREHEFRGPGDIKVDVVPAGPRLLDEGYVTWPSGTRMSLAGMRLAFEHARLQPVANDLAIPVAPLPVVVLLKMTSYLDRPAQRERDLVDFAYVLDAYPLGENVERAWSKEPIEAQVALEHVPAFLLGLDLGRVIGRSEREVIERFVARARDEAKPTHALLLRHGRLSWRSDGEDAGSASDGLLARLDAFEAGLSAHTAGS